MPTLLFEDTKVGDAIAIRRRTGIADNDPYFRATVDHVTATQLVAVTASGSKWRFKRKDGYEVGGGQFTSTWAKPGTPAIDAEIAAHKAARELAERRSVLGTRLHALAHKVESSAARKADASQVERFAALVEAAERAFAEAKAPTAESEAA